MDEGVHCVDDLIIVCGATPEQTGPAFDCGVEGGSCIQRPADGQPVCLVPPGARCLIDTGDGVIIFPCGQNRAIDRNMGCVLTGNNQGTCRRDVPGCGRANAVQACANDTFVSLQCIDYGDGNGQRIAFDCTQVAGTATCDGDLCVQQDEFSACTDDLIVCREGLFCDGAVPGESAGICQAAE